MSTEDNRRLVTEYFRTVWMRGNWERVGEFVAPGFVNHGSFPGMPSTNIADAQRIDTQTRAAFPDLTFSLPRVVADGDLVARHWTAEATHTGEFMGVPATGRRVHMQGMVFSRVVDGGIAEEWRIIDSVGLLDQLRS